MVLEVGIICFEIDFKAGVDNGVGGDVNEEGEFESSKMKSESENASSSVFSVVIGSFLSTPARVLVLAVFDRGDRDRDRDLDRDREEGKNEDLLLLLSLVPLLSLVGVLNVGVDTVFVSLANRGITMVALALLLEIAFWREMTDADQKICAPEDWSGKRRMGRNWMIGGFD